MGVRFGNLTINEFEKRTAWTLAKEDKEWLEKHRCSQASNVPSDKFHIFDLPFSIVCGDIIATKLNSMMNRYNDKELTNESFVIVTDKEKR